MKCSLVIVLTISTTALLSLAQEQAPPNALQAADILGISSQALELRSLRNQRLHNDSMRVMQLRQEIHTSVLAASLDVDSVLAEIDNERAQLSDMRTILQSKRDRGLNVTTIGNIVSGAGSGILGTALQFNDSTAILGDQIGVAASSASTALQVYSLHQQHGGSMPVGRIPNMLAPFFKQPFVLQSEYPEDVWKYLNSAPIGEPQQTRVQALMATWVRDGRVSANASQSAVRQLTGSMMQTTVTINAIDNRTSMLNDVRGRVSLMKRDLAELLRSVR